jgi:hypothetical protein
LWTPHSGPVTQIFVPVGTREPGEARVVAAVSPPRLQTVSEIGTVPEDQLLHGGFATDATLEDVYEDAAEREETEARCGRALLGDEQTLVQLLHRCRVLAVAMRGELSVGWIPAGVIQNAGAQIADVPAITVGYESSRLETGRDEGLLGNIDFHAKARRQLGIAHRAGYRKCQAMRELPSLGHGPSQ